MCIDTYLPGPERQGAGADQLDASESREGALSYSMEYIYIYI